MASFLSKFVKGAAGAGAEIMGSQVLAEMQAELTAKRDAVLNANKMSLQKQQQSARATAVKEEQEHAKTTAPYKLAEIGLETAEERGTLALKERKTKAESAELSLKAEKRVDTLMDDFMAAKNPEEQEKITLKLLAALEKPFVPSKGIEGKILTETMKYIIAEKKRLELVPPGSPGYKTNAQIIEEGIDIVMRAQGGKPPPGGKFINRSELTPQDRIIVNNEGTEFIIRQGKWLTILD